MVAGWVVGSFFTAKSAKNAKKVGVFWEGLRGLRLFAVKFYLYEFRFFVSTDMVIQSTSQGMYQSAQMAMW